MNCIDEYVKSFLCFIFPGQLGAIVMLIME